MTNQEILQKYKDSLALLSKESVSVRFYFLNKFSNEIQKSFLEITSDDLRGYIIRKKDSGAWLQPSTIAQYLILLKIFYKFLVNENLIKDENNPTKTLKAPRGYAQGELRTMSVDELRKLIKTAESSSIELRERLIFYLAITSGLRASEICSIKKSNIDFTKRLIYIPKDDVKGKYREKLVPISNRTKDILELYLIKYPTLSDFLFENRFGKKIKRLVIYNAMKTIIDIAFPYTTAETKTQLSGVWKKPYGSHIARHTFATRWIESGGDLHALRAIMGWRSFSQLDRYVNVSPQFISKAAFKVERKLLKV